MAQSLEVTETINNGSTHSSAITKATWVGEEKSEICRGGGR